MHIGSEDDYHRGWVLRKKYVYLQDGPVRTSATKEVYVDAGTAGVVVVVRLCLLRLRLIPVPPPLLLLLSSCPEPVWPASLSLPLPLFTLVSLSREPTVVSPSFRLLWLPPSDPPLWLLHPFLCRLASALQLRSETTAMSTSVSVTAENLDILYSAADPLCLRMLLILAGQETSILFNTRLDRCVLRSNKLCRIMIFFCKQWFH